MIYRLHHATTYDYAQPVVLGTHFMHLVPRERPGQFIRESQLAISPAPELRRDETDHFGNVTTTVSLTLPHRQFVVALSATVDVAQPTPPRADFSPCWEEISHSALRRAEIAEFCLPSPLAAPTPDILSLATDFFPQGEPILSGLIALNKKIYDLMTYRGGITTTATTAAQVFKGRIGVCQDYAHLMIAVLRALNLPARYVSGYLRTLPIEGVEKRRGADQSHAWCSAWCGDGIGWVDFDPTNNLLVHDEHVTLAWGRDFQDVSPLRGIILGGGRHTLRVNVDLDPVLT
jgi:transglutaminase-like putative cysteine protease